MDKDPIKNTRNMRSLDRAVCGTYKATLHPRATQREDVRYYDFSKGGDVSSPVPNKNQAEKNRWYILCE